MKPAFLKRVNLFHLIGIAALLLYPIYSVAAGTTSHDSLFLTLLNLIVLCILICVFFAIWFLIPLLMLAIYYLKGKAFGDISDALITFCSFFGLFFAMWVTRDFPEIYKIYQTANIKIVFGR